MSAQRKRVNRLRALEWTKAREAALERDDHRCQAHAYGLNTPCDLVLGLVVHHMRRRKGQRDVHALHGLVTLCEAAHHRWVHANTGESYRLGLLVHSGAVEVGLKLQHRALVKSQVAADETGEAA